MLMPKTYLGDGCYVEYDGQALVLTTSDGLHDTNRIVLEQEVYGALVDFVDALKQRADEIRAEGAADERA